jgi:hypothetical protein
VITIYVKLTSIILGTWHMERKKAILKAYPEVKSLYGQNPGTAVLLAVCLAAHCYLAYYFSLYSW